AAGARGKDPCAPPRPCDWSPWPADSLARGATLSRRGAGGSRSTFSFCPCRGLPWLAESPGEDQAMTQDTRKDRRVKIVSLNVRYKSATVDEFIENHSYDVSKGGIFIKPPAPFPPGTLLKFEIRI